MRTGRKRGVKEIFNRFVKRRKFIVGSIKTRDKTPLVSLKGMAFLCAIEAGLVQKLPDGGYEEASFLRFWNAFSTFIPANRKGYANELESIANLLEKEGEA